MDWNGMIRNSEITKYTFFSYSSSDYKRLYCIALQVVNMYLCLKTVTCILIMCFNLKLISYSFKTSYY